MNFKTQSAELYYSMSHTSLVCTGKVLYIPVCLHIQRITPENMKKLMRGNKNQSMKGQNAREDWLFTTHPAALLNFPEVNMHHVFALLSETACLNSSKTQWFPRAPITKQVLKIFLLVYRLETRGKKIILFKTKITAQTGSILQLGLSCPIQEQRVFKEAGQCEAMNFTTMGLLFNTGNSTAKKLKIAGLTFVMFHLCHAKFHLH